MKSRPRLFLLVLAAVGAAATPLVFTTVAFSRPAALFSLSVVLLSGLHVVTGLTRVVSLCHAALAGVGAYTSAIVATRLGLPPLAGVALGAAAAAGASAILAGLTARLEEHYLALATLAAAEILTNIFRSATALTGGTGGITSVPPLSVAGYPLDTPPRYYVFCAVMAAAVFVAVWRLDRAVLGRALRAMGDEGLLVESFGVSTTLLRVAGFVIGGALAGLAGAVSAHVDGFVGPESFGVGLSIGYLCFLVIGGVGRLRGVLLGAALVSFGAEILRQLAEWQMVIVAAVALVVLCGRAVSRGAGAAPTATIAGEGKASP